VPADRSVCLIHPENVASIRVAAKAGYSQTHVVSFNGAPTLLFERPRGGTRAAAAAPAGR